MIRVRVVKFIVTISFLSLLAGCFVPENYSVRITIDDETIIVDYAGNLALVPLVAELAENGNELSAREIGEFTQLAHQMIREFDDTARISISYSGQGRFRTHFTARRARPAPGQNFTLFDHFRFLGPRNGEDWALALSTPNFSDNTEFMSDARALGLQIRGDYCINTELPVLASNQGRRPIFDANTYCWDFAALDDTPVFFAIADESGSAMEPHRQPPNAQASDTTAINDQDYPRWIADRYCASQTNRDACEAELRLSDLLGQTDRLQTDTAEEQWGQQASYPRLARCIYEHPAHPDWNFDAACFYTQHSRVSAVLREWKRVGVENGSAFTLHATHTHGAPTDYVVNDSPAQLVQRAGRDCYEVRQTREVFCVWPQQPPPNPSTQQDSQTISAPPQPGPGGLTERREGICQVLRGEELRDEEPCIEDFICDLDPIAQVLICSQRYTWPSGSVTVLSMFEDYMINSINGQQARGLEISEPYWDRFGRRNCVVNVASSNTFCFTLNE